MALYVKGTVELRSETKQYILKHVKRSGGPAVLGFIRDSA